jgi:hypothetical protein
MRVALCLFGHFRSFDRCYDNLRKHVLEPYQPDVFAQAWVDTMGHWQPRHVLADPFNHPGFRLDSPPVDAAYLRQMQELLKPVDVHLDHYYLHDDRFQKMANDLIRFKNWEHTNAPKSTLSMNWTRAISISMKEIREMRQGWRYDRAIVTRWDIDHTRPIDISSLDPTTITFMKGGGDHPGDTWACATSELMDQWGAQYSGINELVSNGTMDFGPHEWQTAWFEHRKIPWINRTDLGTNVLR